MTAALVNESNLLCQLKLSRNRLITDHSYRIEGVFARIPLGLSIGNSLFLEGMNIGDEGAEASADGLTSNTTLKHLTVLPDLAGITSAGWLQASTIRTDQITLFSALVMTKYCYMGSLNGMKQ